MEFSILSSRADVHDAITGKRGSWQKTVDTLDEALRQGIRVVPVVVVSRLNAETVVDTMRFFREKGIRQVMVNRYNIGGEGLNQAEQLSLGAKQLRVVFRNINHYSQQSGMRIFSGVCTPYCLLDPLDYPAIRFGSCPEDVYLRPLTFDVEGNLRLCNHSPVVAGNIFETPLCDILHSAYVAEWSKLDIDYCRSCRRLSKCRGGCRAATEQVGLSLQRVDPVVEEMSLIPFN